MSHRRRHQYHHQEAGEAAARRRGRQRLRHLDPGLFGMQYLKDNLDRDATRVGSSTVKMTPGPTIVTPAKSTLYLRVTAYLI